MTAASFFAAAVDRVGTGLGPRGSGEDEQEQRDDGEAAHAISYAPR